MHIVSPPPSPPKKLHKHCLQFLLDTTVIPREIEDNGYTIFFFWGGGGGGGKEDAVWSRGKKQGLKKYQKRLPQR